MQSRTPLFAGPPPPSKLPPSDERVPLKNASRDPSKEEHREPTNETSVTPRRARRTGADQTKRARAREKKSQHNLQRDATRVHANARRTTGTTRAQRKTTDAESHRGGEEAEG